MDVEKKHKYYILNFMVAFLCIYGIVMLLPILSTLQEYFGVSVTKISWLPNIGYLNMIIFSPIIGIFAKKVKVNKLLLVTISIWVLGIVVELIGFKRVDFNMFALGRFIEGIGEASFFPILLIINKERIKNESDSKVGLSLIEIGSAIGGLISGTLAGLMSKNLGGFLVIPMVLGVITIIYVMTTIDNIDISKGVESNVVRGGSNKIFISLLISIFIGQAVFVSSQVYLSYYLEIFNMVNKTGIIIALQQICITLGALAPVILLKKFEMKQIRNSVAIAVILSLITLVYSSSFVLSIGVLLIISFATGVVFTTLNIALSNEVKHNVSQKMSIYTAVRFLGGFIFSYNFGNIIGKLRQNGYEYSEIFSKLYLGVLIIVILVAIIVCLLQKKKKARLVSCNL